METALMILIFGWIKFDLEMIKKELRACPVCYDATRGNHQ